MTTLEFVMGLVILALSALLVFLSRTDLRRFDKEHPEIQDDCAERMVRRDRRFLDDALAAQPVVTTKTIGLARTGRHYSLGTLRNATSEEAALGMALKLHEEVAEVVRDPGDVSEYADVLQALMDYAALNQVSWNDIMIEQVHKRDASGPFFPAKLWKRNP